MRRAVFLDRDGILNKEIGDYITRLEDFEVNEGVTEALSYWQNQGFHLIVVTNQGGIAKGLYSHHELDRMHEYLRSVLNQGGVHLDEIYYSPHHPDFGNSLSRKPESLLIEKGLAKFRLDPGASYMIGDRPRDIEAAEKAGVKGILVEANTDLRSLIPLVQ